MHIYTWKTISNQRNCLYINSKPIKRDFLPLSLTQRLTMQTKDEIACRLNSLAMKVRQGRGVFGWNNYALNSATQQAFQASYRYRRLNVSKNTADLKLVENHSPNQKVAYKNPVKKRVREKEVAGWGESVPQPEKGSTKSVTITVFSNYEFTRFDMRDLARLCWLYTRTSSLLGPIRHHHACIASAQQPD